jgi:protease-4
MSRPPAAHRPARVRPPFERAPRLLLLVASLLAGCQGNPSRKQGHEAGHEPGRELRCVRLEQPSPESPEHGVLDSDRLTHRTLLQKLYALAKADDASGLLLQIGEMGGAWGRVADLRDALASIRKARKPVHCHFEVTDNLGYSLLASSCDRISITPAGMLELVGVSAEAIYAHQLLENLGLDADVVQVGKFKGAADPFTRDDMPPEVQQTMNALLDDLQSTLVTSIAKGRGLSPAATQALIDRGPFTSGDALGAKLVDAVEFDDAARATAKVAAKAERVVDEELQPAHESLDLGDLLRALKGEGEKHAPPGKRLVLAYLDGTIMRGSKGSFRSAHAEAFVKRMRQLADDADVRAVVLRIDSPGGSAMASDLMWQAVRRVVKRKPVIVSIGDLCASGGYYVASAGTEILAQDDSLIGSIGIVGGKVVAERLAERVGVHVQRLSRGKHAGWTSATRRFTNEERASFDHALHDGYDRFIARIAEGRNLPASVIEPLAEGRIMSARRARAGRLIDGQGGLAAAIAVARKRGGLSADAPVQVWPPKPSLLQSLSAFSGGSAARYALLEQLGAAERVGIVETLLAGDDLPAAVLPFVLSLH